MYIIEHLSIFYQVLHKIFPRDALKAFLHINQNSFPSSLDMIKLLLFISKDAKNMLKVALQIIIIQLFVKQF